MADGANAAARAEVAGTFHIGGEIEINRLGFGALQLAGPSAWGRADNPAEAACCLAAFSELGVNFIDTADSYGPGTAEEFIRDLLHPYEGMLVATKGGLMHPGPSAWKANGDPDYLRRQAIRSCDRLGVSRLDLWQLHRIDPDTPREVQFAAVRSLIDDGLVRHAGLSEVDIDDIEAASEFFPVATVQNRYNLLDRRSEAVLDHCELHGIGFVPWAPLASGGLRNIKSTLGAIARAHDARNSQIALAWLLKRSPVMLPIPGTTKLLHLKENVSAASISLSDREFAELDAIGKRAGRLPDPVGAGVVDRGTLPKTQS